jgi:hypothetical protein
MSCVVLESLFGNGGDEYPMGCIRVAPVRPPAAEVKGTSQSSTKHQPNVAPTFQQRVKGNLVQRNSRNG